MPISDYHFRPGDRQRLQTDCTGIQPDLQIVRPHELCGKGDMLTFGAFLGYVLRGFGNSVFISFFMVIF